MAIRLFSRRRPAKVNPVEQLSVSSVEPLEDRTLMSGVTKAIQIVADNRGQVAIRFSNPLNATTLSTSTCKIYTAGPDGILNTADDVQVKEPVTYNKSKYTVTLAGRLPADTSYRVWFSGSKIKDTSGKKIDGEYHGTLPSGNGVQGGDLNFRAKRDTSATPTVRFSTNMGDIDVLLYRSAGSGYMATPINVSHFLSYANGAQWDGIFITRMVPSFIVQMGGLKLNSSGAAALVPDVPSGTTIVGEPGNSNVRGTIAFALSNGPDTADNEFFFNTVTNTMLDDTSDGGPFTVFGRIANSKGLAVLDAINALHRIDLSANPPKGLGGTGTDVSNIPVTPGVTVSGETSMQGGTALTTPFNTFADLVYISRVSVLSKLVAFS